jgi:aminopeptidase N
MKTETSVAIRREDYKPSPYRIRAVHLDFALEPQATKVYASLDVEAQGPERGPLVLHGEHLTLLGLKIDGRPLGDADYALTAETLTIHAPPRRFCLETAVEIAPERNSALSGLYMSDGFFCTQCEAEGFRRITYFLDRPDNMAVFTTRMTADRTRYPVLLGNGNPVSQGHLPGGRHFAEWHDPFPKPSYLFALVAGDLARVSGEYVTMSGRRVELGVYVDRGNEGKCGYALDALKRSMRWDEEVFGREYDLDIFNIVAVGAFNFGAMENKGLNIFNDKLVLASPETATDTDYELIEAVVAHEYFHNWTGNRITCRDWFQLCLKEGLTVYRDQRFSADMRSAAVHRIAEVKQLRNRQFREDAGPLAHNVRPDSYQTIDNFYTATVYEKGAELCRMIHTIVGAEGFRKGMDLYFERHDGTAATVEDFAAAFETATGKDLSQFRRWWAQAGTPHVTAQGRYDASQGVYELTLEQTTRPTPGQPVKEPFHIPLRVGLLDGQGRDMAVRVDGAAEDQEPVLHLTQPRQTLRLAGVKERPVPSLNRGFSAPITLDAGLTAAERGFLLAKDADAFNRWDAGQQYATAVLVSMAETARSGAAPVADPGFIEAFSSIFRDARRDPAFAALMLALPTEGELAQAMTVADPDAIHAARMTLIGSVARANEDTLQDLYAGLNSNEPFSPDAGQAGRRALRNACLRYLTAQDGPKARGLAAGHFAAAANMTDSIAGLAALTDLDGPERQEALSTFRERWAANPLVLDKWLSVQAMSCRPDTLTSVQALLSDPAFTMRNPNRVRSLIGAFATGNPLRFHAADGSGYAFVAGKVIELDAINPQVAARLTGAFETWRKYDETRQAHAKSALQRILAAKDLSTNTAEMAGRTLG